MATGTYDFYTIICSVALSRGERGIMDLIIPEGINRGDTQRVPKAPRGSPEVDPRKVIQDRIPSSTPDNAIVHQFKTSSAAGG